MLIERRSPFTGEINQMNIDVTHYQLMQWKAGMLIQDAMPNVPPEQREFIMTGITPKEWDDMVANIEDKVVDMI